MNVTTAQQTNKTTEFLENCFLIKDYADLVKLVEMDLSLIKNPELKDIVENIRDLVENVDKLPELMHNILIYNSVVNFVTNYTSICYKINENNNHIANLNNEIKSINKKHSRHKKSIIKNLTRFQTLKHKIIGDNIHQIKHSMVLNECDDIVLQLKTNISKKTALTKECESLKLKSKTMFESNFNQDTTEFELNLGSLIDSIEDHVLLDLNDEKINFEILDTLRKIKPHNLLQKNKLNENFQPSYMNDIVENQPTLRDKATLSNKQREYNEKINKDLNLINKYFVHNLDLEYLADESNFIAITSAQKVYRTNKNQLISGVAKNLDFIKTNQNEMMNGALIYIAGGVLSASMFNAADINIQQNWLSVAASNFLISGVLENIFNVKGFVYLAKEVAKLSPIPLVKQIVQTTNETLNNVPQFEIKKKKPDNTPEAFNNDLQTLEEKPQTER